MPVLTDYIASLPEPGRSLVDRLRERALAIVPEAQEGMSYAMPALLHRGKGLVSVLQLKSGVLAIYPFSGHVVAQVIPQLPGFDATKGGIKFTVQRPITDQAYDLLVALRRDEIELGRTR